MKVVLNTEDIRLINLFQNLTGSHVIDCYNNDELYVIVANGQYGLAVGKGGSKIKNVENVLKKKVKLFEYSDDAESFLKNLIPEAKEVNINLNEKVAEIKLMNSDKAKVIGKSGKNINIIKKFMKRLFDIEDIKIK